MTRDERTINIEIAIRFVFRLNIDLNATVNNAIVIIWTSKAKTEKNPNQTQKTITETKKQNKTERPLKKTSTPKQQLSYPALAALFPF